MKSSHKLPVVITLLAAGACYLVYQARHGDAEQPTSSSPRPGHVAAAPQSAELAALRHEVALLKAEVRAQEQRPAESAKVDAPERAPDEQGRDPEARAEAARKRGEYMARVDAAFREEPTDTQWSSVAAAAIHGAITGDNDLRALAREPECRSRTCRLELADDGSSKLSRVLPVFLNQLGQELPSVVADRVVDASGTMTTVLYMSRRQSDR
jgi:hypothetical protein